ncbi:hypothetical protein M123_2278 [Bacteroides fragilis str. 3976T8]|uniref:Uncharacterized protein n=1 Tax=Bacteroides fragilis str. 3976T8 TaxID=1339314 RepID=A0A016AW70_BACFG|nr:hypothetical protein M123_2278 [Bacteroides fragilis str. 3976T8]
MNDAERDDRLKDYTGTQTMYLVGVPVFCFFAEWCQEEEMG